jgi:hypothetical protein
MALAAHIGPRPPLMRFLNLEEYHLLGYDAV